MAMTTAKMREKARMYENMLDWSKAADCWDDAIKLHPCRDQADMATLAGRDIEAMRLRAKNCRYMAE